MEEEEEIEESFEISQSTKLLTETTEDSAQVTEEESEEEESDGEEESSDAETTVETVTIATNNMTTTADLTEDDILSITEVILDDYLLKQSRFTGGF